MAAPPSDAAAAIDDPSGTVVLCGGLFPGLTNLLAAKLHRDHPEAQRLEIGVRYNPLSQAGPGVCGLMARAMGERAPRFERGELVLGPPLAVGGDFPFWDGPRAARALALALDARARRGHSSARGSSARLQCAARY